ncbi:MAG TPA: DUF58 domain-containing protein [Rectinemataceae bacterium]|nr:DUF58 domain-containing protein [Rectinemataceae bacterium]
MSRLRAWATAASLLLVAAGILFVEPLSFVLALPLAVWLLLGVVVGSPEPRLEATRTASSSFPEPGTRGEMRLAVRHLGPALACLRLSDPILPGMRIVEGEPTWAGPLEAGAQAEIAYAAVFERGAYEFEAIEARAEHPLTAMETRIALACPATLVAPPPPLAPPRSAFRSMHPRPFAGASRLRRQGQGTEFSGTREYAPGDPLRSLNWRAEALWDQGIVNVFEEERAIDVELILDARSEAYEDLALFEAAAAAASAMAERFLDDGDRVAFLCYGSAIEWIAPGSGREQRLRIRRSAGKARLGAHPVFERFDSLPVGLFPPGSLVLLVSPLLGADLLALRSLAALGYRVAVLRPDPLGKGGQGQGQGGLVPEPGARTQGQGQAQSLARRFCALEAEILMSRLLRAGIEILDWNPSRPLASAVLHGGSRP